MDKRIILLCYPEMEDFITGDEVSRDETTISERGEMFRKFIIELKIIPSDLNQAISILRDYFRKQHRGIHIPNLEVKTVALGSESYVLDQADEQQGNIRICLAPANCPNIKSQCVNSLQPVSDKISHLTYIEIPQEDISIKWNEHKEEPFDAILTAGIKWVKYVIFSIIYDILFYYIMGFPDSLEYRKTVAEKKTPIVKRQLKRELVKYYGANIIDDDVYLPITLATIKDMEAIHPEKSLFDLVRKCMEASKSFIDAPKRLFEKLQEIAFADFKASCNNGVYFLYHEKNKWEAIQEYAEAIKRKHTERGESIYISMFPGSSERPSRLADLFANDTLAECLEPNRLYSIVLDEKNLRDIFHKAMNMGLHAHLLIFEQGV